jgi:copper chaperone CopZ
MMRHILKAIGLSGLLIAAPAALAAESLKITVNGMVCAFCAQGIEKRLSKMPATQQLFVDLKNRVVAVEAKAGQKFDIKQVREEIENAGYEVAKVEEVSMSVAEIRAAISGK